MIKIICLADLEKVSDSAARYIAEKELTQLFSLYQIDNISCCGSIFVIESSAEFENFAAMGLTEPINRNFEFTEKYIFKKCNREDQNEKMYRLKFSKRGCKVSFVYRCSQG